mmetsp:Transcript_8485/g.31946  ORF Transcript_8485/g.31946 Transcript_8485/m.31946 type:complete len:292 (+) Transcript_8485:736-1611(+)
MGCDAANDAGRLGRVDSPLRRDALAGVSGAGSEGVLGACPSLSPPGQGALPRLLRVLLERTWGEVPAEPDPIPGDRVQKRHHSAQDSADLAQSRRVHGARGRGPANRHPRPCGAGVQVPRLRESSALQRAAVPDSARRLHRRPCHDQQEAESDRRRARNAQVRPGATQQRSDGEGKLACEDGPVGGGAEEVSRALREQLQGHLGSPWHAQMPRCHRRVGQGAGALCRFVEYLDEQKEGGSQDPAEGDHPRVAGGARAAALGSDGQAGRGNGSRRRRGPLVQRHSQAPKRGL